MKNKVVIITGASSGIGKACVSEFFKRGARLVLVARTESKLVELTNSIKNLGGSAIYIVADVSLESDCKNVMTQTIETYGCVDILVNNAGISMRALFSDLDLRDFEKIMKINFYGTVYCTKYALKYILKAKGSVVGVSSIAGHKGLPGRPAYSASPGFTASNIRENALDATGKNQKNSPRN